MKTLLQVNRYTFPPGESPAMDTNTRLHECPLCGVKWPCSQDCNLPYEVVCYHCAKDREGNME